MNGVIRGRCPRCGGKIIYSEFYQNARDYTIRKDGKVPKRYVSRSGELSESVAACENGCGVYTNIEIEFSERLYVGSNALEGNRYDIVPPPPVGQSAAGELRTGSYITQSDRTGIDLHPQPGLSFETGLHAAAVVLESSKTDVDLPAPERRSAQNALHARTGMVESSRTAADMILYDSQRSSPRGTC